MARINKPSLTINGIEFQCKTKSVTLAPTGEALTYCDDEWEMTATVLLTYDTAQASTGPSTGTWNDLNAMENTKQTCVLMPEDATIGVDNPTATFTALIPPIPFMNDAQRKEHQEFDLTLTVDGTPVFTTS